MVLVFSLRILLAGSISPPCIASRKAGGRKKETVFFPFNVDSPCCCCEVGRVVQLRGFVFEALKVLCSKFCSRQV